VAIELKDTNIKAHLMCGQVLLAIAKQNLDYELADQGLRRITRAATLCPSQKMQVYEKDLNLYLLRGKKLKWFIELANFRERKEKLMKKIAECETRNMTTPDSVKQENMQKLLKYTEEEEQALPDYFACRLSGQLLIDPVILPSGHSFERSRLQEHISQKGLVDPVTG
jgi:STIP1 family protein 1